MDRRAAQRRVQLSAYSENAVSDGFGFLATEIHSPKQFIAGIDLLTWRLLCFGGASGRLPINGRSHEHLVKALYLPPVVHEINCEPVQQLWVCGWAARSAKVFRC